MNYLRTEQPICRGMLLSTPNTAKVAPQNVTVLSVSFFSRINLHFFTVTCKMIYVFAVGFGDTQHLSFLSFIYIFSRKICCSLKPARTEESSCPLG